MYELIGTEEKGAYRMEINPNVLDAAQKIKQGDKTIIPLNRLDNDFFTYDEVFEVLASQANDNTHDVDPYADESLELIFESGNYYIGSNIHRLNGLSIYQKVQIHLNNEELKTVNQLVA